MSQGQTPIPGGHGCRDCAAAVNEMSRRHWLRLAGGAVAAGVVLGTTDFIGGSGRAGAEGPKVYLDPGHGGSDSGAVGYGLQEKDLTLDIALQTRDILLAGWVCDVRMSRTSDVFVSLDARTNDANAWGAAFFVSVHHNAGGGTGFESYRYLTVPPETITAQNLVHDSVFAKMNTISPVTDRGKKAADFHVLRETAMHAVLTENLFIDTEADANQLANPAFRTATAQGHAEGIAAFLGLAPHSAPPPPPSGWTATVTTGQTEFGASENWGTSTWSDQKTGDSYRYAAPVAQSDAGYFGFSLPDTGNYQVDVWHPADAGYNAATPHIVFANNGNHTVTLDQRTDGGTWRTLGTFPFDAGDRNTVAVSRWTSASGYVIANAARMTRV